MNNNSTTFIEFGKSLGLSLKEIAQVADQEGLYRRSPNPEELRQLVYALRQCADAKQSSAIPSNQ